MRNFAAHTAESCVERNQKFQILSGTAQLGPQNRTKPRAKADVRHHRTRDRTCTPNADEDPENSKCEGPVVVLDAHDNVGVLDNHDRGVRAILQTKVALTDQQSQNFGEPYCKQTCESQTENPMLLTF